MGFSPRLKRPKGYRVEREFAQGAQRLFPGLSGIPDEGAVLIVHVVNPRSINLKALSNDLVRAADGGYKTVIVNVPSMKHLKAVQSEVIGVWLAAETLSEIKEDRTLREKMCRSA